MTEEPQKNSVSIKITGLRINSLNGIIFKEKMDGGNHESSKRRNKKTADICDHFAGV